MTTKTATAKISAPKPTVKKGKKASKTYPQKAAKTPATFANPNDTKGGKMAFLYEKITRQILAQLEKGVKPWERQYSNSGCEMPQNYLSKRKYTSINLLLTILLPFERPYYLTHGQIENLGGNVRKGEKGHIVTFWKFPDEAKKQELLLEGKSTAPLFSYYYVWNVAQIEGIDFILPDISPQKAVDESLKQDNMQAVVSRMQADGITLNHLCLDTPGYEVHRDMIIIPVISDFKTPANYYKTLYHECIHATGHPKRLNREQIAAPLRGGAKTDEGRSFEELVAELGTSFVLSSLGVNLDERVDLLDNAASYIGSWLTMLGNDRTLIVKAATKAQAAADYILGKSRQDQSPEND